MVAFPEYLDRLDRPEIWQRGGGAQGFVVATIMALVVALGAWVPVTKDFIQLRSPAALWCIVPWLLWSLSLPWDPREMPTGRKVRMVLVVGSATIHVFGQLLVVDCNAWPARFLFGLVVIASMASHGDVARVTWDAPYLPLASTLLVLVPVLRCDSADVRHFAIGLHVFGLVLMCFTGAGRLSADAKEERQRREQEALAASLLAQSHSSAARLEHQLTELMGAHHDARNLLASALLKSDLLHRKFQQRSAEINSAEVEETLLRVRDALKLVSSVFKESIRPGHPQETFSAREVLEKQWADFRMKRPLIVLHVTDQADVFLNLPGGPITFRRILDNLLLNAAEGDGKQGARNLWLDAFLEDGNLHLRVADDGPGFPGEVLTSPRQRFTRKQDGSGLGLLTVDSLVRACSGVLKLSNRPQGGAQVDVFLPVIKAAPGDAPGAAA